MAVAIPSNTPRTVTARGAPKIHRGVALYSYQEEYLVGLMSLEDCIRELSDIGAYGVELLAEMMVPDFPSQSNAWVDQWFRWMDQYHTFPACYTQFIDTMRTLSRNLNLDEGVATMLRDIQLAKRLGIPKIRCLIGTPVDVLEAILPHLEKHDIWLGVELHAPITIDGRLMQRLIGISEKSSHFGFVPDFGIFQNKPSPQYRDRMIRDGALTAEGAAFLEDAWQRGLAKSLALDELGRFQAGPAAKRYAEHLYGMIAPQNPADMLPIMSRCRHIHGKTWGLDENCVDPAIDLSEVIPVLIEGGFDGTIATEYEGQRFVQDIEPFSAVEMIRRHHVMLRRLLGEV